MDTNKKNYFRLVLGLVLCLFVRLIPLRAPNVEPILATLMPVSKIYGALIGFSFAVLSILLYDGLTGTLGVQTFFTVFSYGILGLWAAHYFSAKGRSASGGKDENIRTRDYVKFAIMGTLFYDALTGLTVGPIFFHQSFFGSLLGQIPFTALHLSSNIAFAFILSPAIYNFLVKKRKRKSEEKSSSYINVLNPKII